MPKSKAPPSSKLARAGALPWAGVAQAVVVVGKRWTALSERDRERLLGLLRESRGRIGRLSERERRELRKLVGKLDLKGMGRELLPLVGGSGRRRRRG
ncbi:MAG: hypothetical protein ABSG95_09015 [Solirubrobacteraceae bacterium]|jgi:hypothetical protein